MCIPDTGIGNHPWFVHGVEELVEYAGVKVGLAHNAASDPELYGVGNELYGLLDRDSGHGTFIAGIVRQKCPTADIVTVPVLSSAGSADEVVLQRALVVVLLRHLEGLRDQNERKLVDILSISLGYYHEHPEDLLSDAVFKPLFEEFGKAGVVVVCAAGNDGTMAPMFPAAWAAGPDTLMARDIVPMLAVGAANPDGRSAALFSNVGPWVTSLRPGVAVVSTMPTTFDAARQASVRVDGPAGLRGTIDMDNFASGFAVWSGTSFAAPCLAGQLAEHLARDPGLGKLDREAAVDRGWSAVAKELKWRRP